MPEAPDQGVNSVLYLGTDPALWQLVQTSALALGLHLRGCRTLAGLALAASMEPARVLILEIAALAPGRTPEQVLERMLAESGVRPLLLCLGEAGPGLGNGEPLVLQPPFSAECLTEALELLRHRPWHEGRRVLLLGDSPIQEVLHARLIRGSGLRVALECDPRQVEAAVVRQRPHLAIIDLDWAEGQTIDGRVRDCPGCRDLPIVFLSGDGQDTQSVDERRIGGDDYLVKPVEPEHLLAVVRARLALPDDAGTDLVEDGAHFLRRLDRALAQGDSTGSGQGILFLELGSASDLAPQGGATDLAGPRRLLIDRLSGLTGPDDRAAWLSERGLALWVSRQDDAAVAALADRVVRALGSLPTDTEGNWRLGSVAVGLASMLPGTGTAQTLVSRARAACGQARAAGGSRAIRYPATGGDDPDRRTLADGPEGTIGALLRQALAGHGFRLVYQPMLPLRKLADQRYEVLLRLVTPEGAFIPPLSFLPVAEREGLLPALDRWVLSGALKVLRDERDAGRPTRFLIHQTPESLAAPNWLNWIRDEILRLDLIRQRPALEFSAQGILANEALARPLFPELARLGIEVCLSGVTDNRVFLGLISRRPIACVKLARDLPAQSTARALKSTVEAIHRLGARVIASGIEDPETIGRVWSSGVDYIQGNLIQYPEETLGFNFGETPLH